MNRYWTRNCALVTRTGGSELYGFGGAFADYAMRK